MRRTLILALAWYVSIGALQSAVADDAPEQMWVRGEVAGVPLPLWGFANGLQIGLSPLPGPRGLLRVYAPYLKQPVGHVINFIAVEPIPQGSAKRGLSELEESRLDNRAGKRFWSVDSPVDASPQQLSVPAKGIIETIDGEERLFVYILIEPFDNGAHVYLKLTFQAHRPHEVSIATYAHDDSKALDSCIVTATMGNYARLRRLQLADRIAIAGELWPNYHGKGFAPHAKFPLAELIRNSEGHAMAFAATDEEDLMTASYSADTREHWKYQGDLAIQSWRSEQPHPDLQVWVNGRYTYWASRSPIPGGIAFENFEMVSPFQQGQEFVFSVEPHPTSP